ncbi:MAG: hypothetical protein R3F62_28495 [Planctomycetota bacterium]
MTEYVVIVGLIAICLIAAVRSFSGKINDIIVGTDGNGGIAGETNGVTAGIKPGAVGIEDEDDTGDDG